MVPCTLLILAGGSSRRMGRDKASLPAGDITLVEHLARRLSRVVTETVVATGRARPIGELRTVEDRWPGLGPLAGINAGVHAARNPLVWVVACDLPDVEPELGRLLVAESSGVDAVVPMVDGEPQGVCAIYRTAALPPVIERLVQAGRRSVKSLLDEIRVRYVDERQLRVVDPELRSFRNLNTPADYEAWVRSQ